MKIGLDNKIVHQSIKNKLDQARQAVKQVNYPQAITLYTKCLFLKEDPACLLELALVYEKIQDFSTALNLHKRAEQLGTNQNPRIKQIALIKGYQFLDSGSAKNILEDTEFQEFKLRYPAFHSRVLQLAYSKKWHSLLGCLAYLESDYRVFALEQLEKCKQENGQNSAKIPELLILEAFIQWSLTKYAEGHKLFWKVEELKIKEPLLELFIAMVTPRLEAIYKEVQCLLIDGKADKCGLVIRKGLELHPNHTRLLIAKAYLHRTKEQYEEALCDLEQANRTLKDSSLQADLRNQIALTYNEMGTFLFKKQKYSEAIALFNEGIAFKPSDWGMRANRGDCFKALNQYGKALEDYIAAHNLSGDIPDINTRLGTIYNSRGVAHFNARNYKQAILEFTEAIKYCKKVATFYLNRAKALVEISKLGEAVQDYEMAAKLDPQCTQAQIALKQYRPEGGGGNSVGAPKKKIIYLSNEK